jgi:hypothetical protein
LRYFSRAVLAGAKLGDAPLGHIEAPDRRKLARERQRHRKSDISESDDGKTPFAHDDLAHGRR